MNHFQELLIEAAEWRLLGLLFEYPVESWRRQLEALLPDLRKEALRRLGTEALELATPGLHFALFGPAGSVPVREVTYKGGVQFGYLMAELSAFYDAFGYEPVVSEAEDHIAVELGFVAYLKMKQVFAIAAGDEKSAVVTAEAAAEFIKEHVAMFGEPVLKGLENFGPDFLIEAGRLLLERAGPSPRNSYPLGAAFGEGNDAEEISCGLSAAGSEFVQLQP